MALKTFRTKFRGYFYDPTGVQYTVAIETDEDVSKAQEIRIGATPFVVDCDADENYFKPVRTRTAKLTIIDEDGTLYDQIMPKDNFSTRVSVSRSGVGSLSSWFVSCEAIEKPLVSRPHEVTFNLNGFLAMTEFIKANPIYPNVGPLYGLLYSIGRGFNDAGVSWHRRFWAPRMYNYGNLLDYSWFFETKKYKDIEGDSVEIVGKSVLSIIEAFCKFYGLVAFETPGGIVFVGDLPSYDYNEYIINYGQRPTVSSVVGEINLNTIQWSDLVWMGTEQTVNTIRPAKSVSVVSKIEEYNNDMSLPSFAATKYNMGRIGSRDGQHFCNSLMSDIENIGGTLIMGKPRAFVVNLKKDISSANSYYVKEYTITYNGEVEGAYPISGSFIYVGYAQYPLSKNWPKIAASDFKLNADGLTNVQVWCGAFMARSEVYAAPEKASYSLTDKLFVSGLCYSEILGVTPTFDDWFSKMKAATLRSEKFVKIYNGFINIKASAIMIDYYGNFSDADGVIMNFQLKIGNRYYSDLNGWTEDESFFSVSFKDGKILSNKTAAMQTTEQDGFFIEIPSGKYQEGIVEFSVSPAFWKSGSTDDGKLPMCAMFSELSVNFTYKSSDLAFGDKENHFFALLDEGAKDEIEVENDIVSDCYNKAAENVIKSQYTLNNAQVDDKNNIKPELLLLSRMKEYYSNRRNILSLEVGYGNIPWDNLYSVIWQDGKTYLPLGYSIDYKANKVNLKLFEQPDYPEDIIP